MKILLATDASPDASAALDLLTRIPFHVESDLTFLTVVDDAVVSIVACDARKRIADIAGRFLRVEATRFGEMGWTTRTVIREGHVARQIIETASEFDVDLVVVGSRGLDAGKPFLLGSVSHKVVKYAPCSVLMVRRKRDDGRRGGKEIGPRRIADNSRLRFLLAYDGSSPARAAVETLASLPLQDRAEIAAVTVVRPESHTVFGLRMKRILDVVRKRGRQRLEETSKALLRATSDIETRLLEGPPAQMILDAADEFDADIVLVGDKGRSDVEQFLLGSVTNRVIHHSGCSVWAVRGQEVGP